MQRFGEFAQFVYVAQHEDAASRARESEEGADGGRHAVGIRIVGILGCPVYYARAYASYEKGAVENVNRIIRRWFPKGADFSKVSRVEVPAVEAIINSMYRKSLKGECANDYHRRMAQVA